MYNSYNLSNPISLNFIIELLSSKGFDSILSMVDWFTMMIHFVLRMRTINNREPTMLIMRKVFGHHGLLDEIISNRVLQFISIF